MIILLLSLNAFASWTTVDFFPQSWDSEKLCNQLGTGECYEIQESSDKYKKKTIKVDDHEKPKYSNKKDKVDCLGWKDCIEKKPICVDPFFVVIAQDFTESYCVKINGYDKKDKQVIIYDELLASAFNEKKTLETSEKSAKEAKKQKIKDALKKAIKKEDNTIANEDLEDL